MLFNKIEFGLLCLSALVVSIAAAAHYDAWMVLWAIPLRFILMTVIEALRGMVTEVLGPPRHHACRTGNWPKAYALVVLIALYNRLILTWLPDVVYVLVVWRYKGAMPLSSIAGWCMRARGRRARNCASVVSGDALVADHLLFIHGAKAWLQKG